MPGGRLGKRQVTARRTLYGGDVRWESLFADLESQLEAARAADRSLEVADLVRAERGTVTLVDRLRGSCGGVVTLDVGIGETVSGVLLEVAEQWVLIGDGPRRMLVPVRAVVMARGLRLQAAPDGGEVLRRLGLGHALRALARDRASVRVLAGGAEVVGRVEQVGADHVDLTVGHDARAGTRVTLPFTALQVVRSG